jgi:hypothetical protein
MVSSGLLRRENLKSYRKQIICKCVTVHVIGTTVKNINLIQEEIKWKLISGKACKHSGLNLLFSRLLPKNVNIRIYKTIILPVGYIWV